jgi:hypothetical protein
MMGGYYDELCRAIKPDKRALALVADLNKEGLPWGVVTNGSAVQHVKVKVARVGKMAPFVGNVRHEAPRAGPYCAALAGGGHAPQAWRGEDRQG